MTRTERTHTEREDQVVYEEHGVRVVLVVQNGIRRSPTLYIERRDDALTALKLREIAAMIDAAADEVARATPLAPAPEPVQVDRSQRTLTDGSPVTPDHRDLQPNGQQKAYVVLSEEERAKGFVRPVRYTYVHVPGCGIATTMGQALAETYARDPKFYSGTFCVGCGKHLSVDQFIWDGTDERVGS